MTPVELLPRHEVYGVGGKNCSAKHSFSRLTFLFCGIIYSMKKSKNNTDNDLVTKKYLDERFAKNTSKIIGYVDMRFKSVDEKLEKVDKKLETLDSILKTLDWLAKQYQDLKDEDTVKSEQYRRLDNRVTTLEKRAIAS